MELSYLTTSPQLSAIGWSLPAAAMLFLHCLIGLIAAQVAYRRGGDLGLWLLWGTVGGTLALITALQRPLTQNPIKSNGADSR